MRVLTAAALAFLLLGVTRGNSAPPAKAPLPTILLYPATAGDVAALVDLRTRLRLDSRVEVLTYDPESAAIQRASAEDAHPEWLVSAPVTDQGRMFLARALGAAFYAVVSPGRATDSTHVELVETAPAARTFDWTGSNRQFGVRAIESQVADSISHPASYTASTETPALPTAPPLIIAAAPSVVAAAPSVVAAAPSVVAAAPSVVAAAPSVVAAAPSVVAAAPSVVAAAPSVVAAAPSVVAAAPSVVAAAPSVVAAAPSVVAAAPSVVAAAPSVVAAAPSVVAAAPSVVAAAPSVVAAAPSVVAAAPSVVAAAPSVVAAAPTSAPIIIPLPKAVPPVKLAPVVPAPVPLVQTATAPPKLPVPVVRSLPVPYIPPPRTPAVPTPSAASAIPVMPLKTAAVPVKLPLTVAQALPTLSAPPPSKTVPAPVPIPVAAVPLKVAAPKVPAQTPPDKGTQMAMLPKPTLPDPLSPPFMSLPREPSPPTPSAPKPATVRKLTPKTEDISVIQPLLAKGDSALEGGDAVTAIALYRQAINGLPLSIVPRLKLAQAYQKDGLNDRALDEARRALEIAPDSLPVQQFLSDLDQQTGTTDGTLVRARAALERSPEDPKAHVLLADSLWNNGDLGGAEAEYKAAQALVPAGDRAADAQLAQLYAAEARYGDCLAALKTAGKGGYALAIQIVKNRAETLSTTLSTSRDTFAAGKSTREQFYDDAKKLSAEAQALAGFVAEIKPPAEYRLSHLHRMLSTNLLAQEAATLVTSIETNDSRQNDSLSRLEHAAATEMLTAQATEEKLGLWKDK